MDLLIDGLAFAESPRWRGDRLFISDFHAHRVIAVALDGRSETVCGVPGQPSGLGWLPDGRLLVVSMTDRRILRLEHDGRLVEHADLSRIATFHCNDMVVDAKGAAYVGNFGYDILGGALPVPASLARVDPGGEVSVAATDLSFPNGAVISEDGRHFVLAESLAHRLTAFDICPDGSLANRRTWAQLDFAPDGICLDAEGCIWVADPVGRQVVRVSDRGGVISRFGMEMPCIACALGGPDRTQLFIVCAPRIHPEKAAKLRSGRIYVVGVDVPGAGRP